MKVRCPNCGMQLKAGGKFIEKIEGLGPNEKARVKCMGCTEPFDVGKDVLGDSVPGSLRPPAAPDISWLQSGDGRDGGDDGAEELPTILVLMKESVHREVVVSSFMDHGYRLEFATSSVAAIEKMQFTIYAGVVQESSFETGAIQETDVHKYISSMDMVKRRQMLYILIGDKFRTLYDLEALCYSVNLVVNTKDIKYFSTMLRKVVRENEILFGPLIAEQQAAGR